MVSIETKILIVDDEADILEFLSYNLEKEGYLIRTARNGTVAHQVAKEFLPELIILDIMMPGMDGIELCTLLREDADFNNTLIVFLTARNESFTQVSALESGGDDYITKPIKPSVLKSRVKAILRRHVKFQNLDKDVSISIGDLTIDPEKFKVILKDKEIGLAKKEFDLLTLLASKPGKVFHRADILNQVWGREVIVGDRTIDVHIRKLREKLGNDYIKTYKGVGYKFNI